METIEDILGGLKVHDLFEVPCERLEQIARYRATKDNPKLDSRDKVHVGNLIFLTLANIKVVYCDIVHALTNRVCGVIDRKDGNGLCFPTKLGKVQGEVALLERQNCVGSVVKDKRDPNDFERTTYFDPYYIIDQFGMPAVYDLDTQASAKGDEYQKLPLGDTGRYVRRMKFKERYRRQQNPAFLTVLFPTQTGHY